MEEVGPAGPSVSSLNYTSFHRWGRFKLTCVEKRWSASAVLFGVVNSALIKQLASIKNFLVINKYGQFF